MMFYKDYDLKLCVSRNIEKSLVFWNIYLVFFNVYYRYVINYVYKLNFKNNVYLYVYFLKK